MAKHTRSAGGVVLNDRGQVIIVNQKNNSWSLPKGHIDPGEDAIKAAQREIYEESGVKNLVLVKSLGGYTRRSGNGAEIKNISMFLFKTDQEKLKPADPENPGAVWIDKDKVTDILTYPKDKKFFIKILGELK